MFGRRDKSTGRPTPEGNPGPSGVFGGPPAAGSFGHGELPSDDAELMHSLRSRLMDRLPASPPDVTFDYAQRVGPLYEVLCRDLPDTVSTLSDQALADRDVELFFAAARRNTELESSDLQKMPTKSGVDLWLLEGDGFFVASQLPWLPGRVAKEASPADVGEGLLVVAPRRGSLIAVGVNDELVLRAVPVLLDGLKRFGDGTGFGGLYFVRDPEVAGEPGGRSGFSDGPLVQNVLGPEQTGGIPSIHVEGAFADALLRAGVTLPDQGDGGPGGSGDPDGPDGPDGPEGPDGPVGPGGHIPPAS